ncbi:hypothetical protein ATANTOWER_019220 [Ataeniobius toweri]|uniref:Uncharacterized protein n=1 Tax=Ataeniobius toweri TaxID=208326 RepID=A0ABU7A766_9TELE|nr:hypothetical protein [Ataeniobius toweri]
MHPSLCNATLGDCPYGPNQKRPSPFEPKLKYFKLDSLSLIQQRCIYKDSDLPWTKRPGINDVWPIRALNDGETALTLPQRKGEGQDCSGKGGRKL